MSITDCSNPCYESRSYVWVQILQVCRTIQLFLNPPTHRTQSTVITTDKEKLNRARFIYTVSSRCINKTEECDQP